MRRIMILGAAGMLGHKLCQHLMDHEIIATVRKPVAAYSKYAEVFRNVRLVDGIDALNTDLLEKTIKDLKPEVVINCIGIIKQLAEARDPIASIRINALLPHQLANICQGTRCSLIHISTDCVFDGKRGSYTEDDVSNATDLYGRTKFLGEVSDRTNCLTLRTSIVGRELCTSSGLVEWFLSNRKRAVKGFKRAIYTGFTTMALAAVIDDIVKNHPTMSGLYQVASEPINKFDFLCALRDAMSVEITIEPETGFFIDRSLTCEKFKNRTGFTPPSWASMIEQLASETTPYDKWRNEQ